MIAADTAQPFAEQFADLRAEAIADLKETREKIAKCEGLLAAHRTAEDSLLNALAMMEQFARGDFTLAGTV